MSGARRPSALPKGCAESCAASLLAEYPEGYDERRVDASVQAGEPSLSDASAAAFGDANAVRDVLLCAPPQKTWAANLKKQDTGITKQHFDRSVARRDPDRPPAVASAPASLLAKISYKTDPIRYYLPNSLY